MKNEDLINPLVSFIDAKCREPDEIMKQIDLNISIV
jgi:hypothetical protein